MRKVKFCEVSAPRLMEEDFRLEEEAGKWFLTLARGQCRTGGYDICLHDVEFADGVITATVEKINPDPHSFVTMAITFPVRKYELDLSEEPKDVKFIML